MEINQEKTEIQHDISNLQIRVESILELLKSEQIKLEREVIGDLAETLTDLESFLLSTGVKQ